MAQIFNIYFDGQFTKLVDDLNYQAIGGHDQDLYKHIDKNVYLFHYLGKGKNLGV